MARQTIVGTDELRAQWSAASAKWIERVRSGGDSSRSGLLDVWMLKAVGDVAGKRVIDLGCGEGRFCRMLRDRGGQVTGVDLCEAMIDAAKRADEGGTYLVADAQKLAGVGGGFDLAVAYLSLIDFPDFRAAVARAYEILKPGGRFVVCNLASMVTAGNMWLKYGDGTRVCFRLDNYCDESERVMPMCGVNITNYHRMLSSYVNAFLEAGFTLTEIQEPVPSAEQLAGCPDNADMLRVPLFVIYLLRK